MAGKSVTQIFLDTYFVCLCGFLLGQVLPPRYLERVAPVYVPGFETAPEPADPLLGGAVGERVGNYESASSTSPSSMMFRARFAW
jgi:hypothetical protein